MRTLFVLATLLAAGCVSAPAAQPGPAHSDDDRASGRIPNLFLIDQPNPPGGVVHGGSEPMVLADRDGEYLWIGSTGGAARSADNGTTWKNLLRPFALSADGWSLAQDEMRRVYVTTTGMPNVEVYRSDDDGSTWIHPGLPGTRPPLSGTVDVAPIADRPWVAARGDGEVMLIHYDFGRTNSESCLHSTDAGKTWTDRDPTLGSANAGRPDFDALGRFGYTDTRGTLHVLGQSTNGLPRCMQDPLEVRMFQSFGVQPLHTTSAMGNVFFSAAPTSGNAAIQIAGYDGAAVKQLVVSPPVLKVNTFATVSASADDIAVAWYATETAGAWQAPGFQGEWNVYVARVQAFFSSSPTITLTRLTTEPNHVGEICTGGLGCTGAADRDLLDYFGVDHDIWGGVHVAYAHDGDSDLRTVRHAHLA